MSDAKSFGTRCLFCLALLVVVSFAVGEATAEPLTAQQLSAKQALELSSIFTDHMVLQRDRAIPIWGTANPGTVIRVQLSGKTREATADQDGRWRVDLGPLPAGGPLEMRVWSDGAVINLTDILIGEVWVASGQSNMQWPLWKTNDAKPEVAAADWPEIRLITLPRRPTPKPKQEFKSSGWQACTPQVAKDFSAVAYFFGRELHKEYDVPIGLISTNFGGTPMEAWTSYEALASRPTFAKDAEIAKSASSLEKFEGEAKLNRNRPTGLYNGMVHPLIPYGIQGVIWYQGEANAKRKPEHYRELSELMITDWRTRWDQGDFPFLLVQLAGFRKTATTWPFLREAQLQTIQTVSSTGMAVATDIGDPKDIHPRNKQEVGKRLALAARAIAYGEDIVYSGPIYREIQADGDRVRIQFDHVGGGLMARDGELKGFEVAAQDGKYEPATATIEGQELVVSSSKVKAPVSVRYNWSGWTEGNLYNAEGLPASPFRTGRF